MRTDNVLTLPDGRKLAFAEFGQPDGHTVLYFHATPSSRLEPIFLGDDLFSRFGLRIICPDRPGIGGSDFQIQRSFSDWPEDVEYLLENLGIDQCSVLGVSGGGGYAAVCAAKIPEKIVNVVIASGAWQIDAKALKRIGFPMNLQWQLAKHAPMLLPLMLKLVIKMISQEPKGGFENAATKPNKFMPAADHAVMTPDRIAINRKVLEETMKQGSKGPVWDMCLYVREWDFDLAELDIPLTLFHGEQDLNVPVELVRRKVHSIPGVDLITFPEDGHISVYTNHFDEIAKALLPSD